jgi:hypothetical protein
MSNYIEKSQPETKLLETAQAWFQQAATAWEASHNEAELVNRLYDDNHYTEEQIMQLQAEGRPIETYNVIKKYTRNLVGYLSTVVTDINVKPTSYDSVTQAKVRDSTIKYILRQNNWDNMQDDIVRDSALSGLAAFKYMPVKTGKKDVAGREIIDINIQLIPSRRVLPDPLDNSYDYSKSRYTHEWQWIPEEEMYTLFGKRKVRKLLANGDMNLDMPLAGFEYNYIGLDDGKFKRHNHYLVVRTVMKHKGKLHNIYWCGNHQLHSSTLDYEPYRCIRLNKGTKEPEFYGVFREIIGTQQAINQAVLQIQLLVNSDKVFVDENVVDDIAEFTRLYNRVNAVIGMSDLDGYRIENFSQDIIQQYNIIDSAIQRIQALLGINDSFLGLAAASDSGRKVQLQQSSSVVALRYFTRHIEHIYKTIGEDLVRLSRQYMTAHRVMRLQTDMGKDTWAEINKPFYMPKPYLGMNGNIEYDLVFEPILDLNTKSFRLDPSGNIQHKVVNEPDTDITTEIDVDIEVKTSAYGETEEVQRVVLESMMNGNPGMMLQQYSPARYAKLIELYAKALKSEFSPELVDLFQGVQEDLGGLPERDPRDTDVGQGQGLQNGNISANTGALTQAMGINNNLAGDGYNAKKG